MRASAPSRVPPLTTTDGCWSGPGCRSAMASREPMSCPEENIGPAPHKMTTRTVSSASARKNASPSSTSRPRFCALRVRGRSRVILAMTPSSSVSYLM